MAYMRNCDLPFIERSLLPGLEPNDDDSGGTRDVSSILKAAENRRPTRTTGPSLHGAGVEPKYANPKPLSFLHPSRSMLLGGTGSGKTFFLADMLEQSSSVASNGKKRKFHGNWNKVYWLAPKFSAEQPVLKQLQKKLGGDLVLIPVEVGDGLDQDGVDALKAQLSKNNAAGIQSLVVNDDLAAVTTDKVTLQFISELAISGRHLNTSLATLTQRGFSAGSRTARLQLNYIVLFRIGASEVTAVLRQQFPIEWKTVFNLYKEALALNAGKPGSYLLIDTDAETSPGREALQFRANSLSTVIS